MTDFPFTANYTPIFKRQLYDITDTAYQHTDAIAAQSMLMLFTYRFI